MALRSEVNESEPEPGWLDCGRAGLVKVEVGGEEEFVLVADRKLNGSRRAAVDEENLLEKSSISFVAVTGKFQ